MAAYLTLAEFKLRTVMPSEFVTAIESVEPGWTEMQLLQHSGWIDARLRKRYAVPFAAPVPETVLGWLARIVTFECWQRRGFDPADLSMDRAAKDADTARSEVLEAADSEKGLFDLPLRQDLPATSGIVRNGPYVYTEASPYVWADQQVATGRTEDGNRRGT